MCAPSAAQTYSGFATSNNAELFSAAVKLVNAPADYFNLFTDWPAHVTLLPIQKRRQIVFIYLLQIKVRCCKIYCH